MTSAKQTGRRRPHRGHTLFLADFALMSLEAQLRTETNLRSGAAGWVGVEWRPTSIFGKVALDNASMRLYFAGDRTVSRHAGCNDFTGIVESTDEGIDIGPLSTTRKACAPEVMQWEVEFVEALQTTKSIERSIDTMRMVDTDGSVVVELEVAPTGGAGSN